MSNGTERRIGAGGFRVTSSPYKRGPASAERPKQQDPHYEIFGVAVHKDIYERYNGQHYNINGQYVTLRGVELWATSKEIAEYFSEDAKAAKKLIETIKNEVSPRKEFEVVKHKDFKGYLEDVKSVYAASRTQYEDVSDKWEQAQAAYKTAMSGPIGEKEKLYAEVDYQRAQDAYNSGMTKLQEDTRSAIASIRAELEKHVKSFYAATPDKLDNATMDLLKTGILTKQEMVSLAEANRGNPVMLRVIGSFIKPDFTDNSESGRALRMLKTKIDGIGNGEAELDGFDGLATWAGKALSGNRIATNAYHSRWEEVCTSVEAKFDALAAGPLDAKNSAE